MIRHKILTTTLLAMGLAFMKTQPAQAQLGWSFVGVGEFDTADTYLVLGGVSVGAQRTGWTPVAGLQAYWVQYVTNPTTDATTSVTAVTPSVGLKNSFETGAFTARVGYTFVNGDIVGGTPAFSSDVTDDGVVTSAQLDYWGTGKVGLQGIATYNFGGESFWGRGRALFRVASFANGGLSVGPEVAYLNTNGYSATKFGGVVGLNPGKGTTINAAVGRKMADGGADATYFGFELVLYPHR